MDILKSTVALLLILLTNLCLAQDVPDVPPRPDVDCRPAESKAIVKWKSTKDNGSPIDRYEITVRNSLAPNLKQIVRHHPEDGTTAEVSLNVWANYTFRVTAFNSIGGSPESEPSVLCEGPPNVPDNNPYRPRGRLTGSNDLVISWLKMGTYSHNGPGFFYRVYYKASDKKWQNVTVHNWKDEEIKISLQQNMDKEMPNYEIKVEANNAIGAAKTSPRTVAASLPHAGVPNTPNQPDIQCNSESRKVTVTWTAPEDNGSPLEAYVVETNTSSFINTYAYDAEDGTSKVFDMSPGVRYPYRVLAMNSIGSSSYSSDSAWCESAPDVPYSNPQYVRGYINLWGKLRIVWMDMLPNLHNGPGFFYRVYYKKVPNAEWENVTVNHWQQSQVEVEVNRDKSDSELIYEVKVEANNAIGTAKVPPAIITVKDKPDIPVVLSKPLPPAVKCHPEKRTATVSWTVPEGGQLPISYGIIVSNSYTPDVVRTTFYDPKNETIREVSLNPGASYTFRVRAQNVDSSSPISERSIPCEVAPDVPYENPTDVRGRVTDTNYLHITWMQMARNLHNGQGFYYRVYYKKASDVEWKNITVPDWEDEETHINLHGENAERQSKYEIKVEANNALGSAKKSPKQFIASSFDADVPSTPLRPVLECNSTTRNVTVRWKAPADNGSPITTYVINMNNSYTSKSVTTSFYDAEDGTYRVVSLDPGPTYSFRVQAINGIGPSSYSEYSVPCEAKPDVPYRNPTGVYGQVNENDNLVIKWIRMQPLEYNGPVFFYRVYFKKVVDKVWNTNIILNGNTEETLINITRGKDKQLETYEVKVEANNQLGTANKPPKVLIAHSGKLKAPNPPLNVHVECNLKERLATIRWNVPDNNGAPILGYKLGVINADKPDASKMIRSVQAEKTSKEISMNPGLKFTFEVVAWSSIGDSAPGASRQSCTAYPDVPYDNPTDVSGQGDEPGNLIVTWKPMDSENYNGPGFFYRVYYKASSDKQWKNVTIEDLKSGKAKINLDSQINITFQKYDIKVVANNALGPANRPPRLFKGYNGEAVPLKSPNNFTLVKLDSSNIASFSWNPVPEDSVRGHFEGYKVTLWSEKPWSPKPKEIKVSPGVTKVILHGLQPGAKNFAHVQAMNSRFGSPPSNIVYVNLPEIPSGPVSYLHIAQMGSTTLGLRWGKPYQPNGLLLGYKIVYQTVNGRRLRTEIEGPRIQDGNITSTRIRNMAPETIYRVKITPINSAGEGRPYFDERQTGKSKTEEPSKPSFIWKKMHREPGTDRLPAIQVTWIPNPTGNAGTQFYVSYKKSNETIYAATKSEKDSDNIIVSGLDPTADYDVKVVAVSDRLEKASDAVRIPHTKL